MKRLEDILEECVNAAVEGRRGVEQSLALYPAYAAELEPLLRTALHVSDHFQAYTPPPALQQRGLHRFLAAANDRRRVRQLEAASFGSRGWFGGIFRNPALAGVVGAAAVVVVTVAIAGGAILSGSGDDGDSSSVNNPPGDNSADTVVVLQAKVDEAETKLRRGHITPGDLAEIQRLLDLLTGQVEEDGEAPPGAETAVFEIQNLLNDINQTNPELANDPVVQNVETSNRGLASAGGIPLATPVAVGGPSTPPADTPTPTLTDPPTVTTGPTPPPAPTPTDTPAPTPTEPVPTETADSRGPQGFGN